MGLQEFLKRAWAQITHRDPEGTDDGFYKFHSDQTTYPADGDVVHEYTASSGVQSPPGVEYYKDTNNDLAWKWKRDTTGLQRMFWEFQTSGAVAYPVTVMERLGQLTPFGSDGTAIMQFGSSLPAWEPFYVTGTLVGGTIDLTIKTAVAGEEVEAILLACGQATVTDQATLVYSILDWEDDDGTAPAAGSSYGFGFKHDTTNSHMLGSPIQNITPHACWGLSNDAQGLQIEWTQVGGAGTENVFISGIRRVH